MPRLIDADSLKSKLIEWRDNDTHRKSRSLVERWVRKTGINVLVRAVDAFPSIPYEPVRHGCWVENKRGALDAASYRCSVCEGYMPFYNGYKYCPNCGAKMDGGADHSDEE